MDIKKIVLATTMITSGGLGTYLINMKEGLKARGWIVHLVTTNNRGDLFEQMEQSVTCHDLSAIPLSKKKVFKAAELVNKISPEVLLMNNCSLIHYALPIISSKTKPVAVLHSDDERFYKTASSFGKRIFRWIAPTRELAEKFKNYIPLEQYHKIKIIPHGVNENIFYPNKRSYNTEKTKITFVGYIAENKGADLLPYIMNKVIKRFPKTTLTVIGYGPLRESLEKIFDEQGFSERCAFTGLLEQDSVADILRKSDIFLLPTRIEGFGLSIAEAMMCGAVPVITNLKGITDQIVDNGENGYLVKRDDVQGFTGAILSLLENRELLQSMSKEAIYSAQQKISSGKMLDSYAALFAEEDDRGKIPVRGKIGWSMETMREVFKDGVDGRWFIRQAKEIMSYRRTEERM